MAIELIAEDNDLDIKLNKGGRVYVDVYDGCQTHKIFEGERINAVIIERSILFADGGMFSPISGLGFYAGTKKSVDDVKERLGI